MSEISEACRAALKWLRERNGTGAFDRDGVLLAAGELAPFTRSTWDRLRDANLVTIEGRRVTVTPLGAARDCGRTDERTPVEEARERRGGATPLGAPVAVVTEGQR